ncbi:MAG: ubiquinone/menaquinone biosynthesis methyltransferase [Planctomycetota bacterium]
MGKTESIFDPIAHYYDFFNRLFSLNIDRSWRIILLNQVQKYTRKTRNINLLDIGTGTGDLLKIFYNCSRLHFKSIIGIDASYKMLEICNKNIRYNNMHNCIAVHADACAMPFESNFFDIVVSAFVIRNIENIRTLFKELYRVLKFDGIFSFLEFCLPPAYFFRNLYRNYLSIWVKNVGDFLTKSKSYSYFVNSIEKFATVDLQATMKEEGFRIINFFCLSNGIVQLGVVRK